MRKIASLATAAAWSSRIALSTSSSSMNGYSTLSMQYDRFHFVRPPSLGKVVLLPANFEPRSTPGTLEVKSIILRKQNRTGLFRPTLENRRVSTLSPAFKPNTVENCHYSFQKLHSIVSVISRGENWKHENLVSCTVQSLAATTVTYLSSFPVSLGEMLQYSSTGERLQVESLRWNHKSMNEKD
jgi:hypothetical protein